MVIENFLRFIWISSSDILFDTLDSSTVLVYVVMEIDLTVEYIQKLKHEVLVVNNLY